MSIGIIISVIFFLSVLIGLYFFVFEGKINLIEKALALAAMGNYLDAKAMLRDELDSNPDNTKLIYMISKIYSMEGDLANEATYLEKIKTIGKYEKEFSPAFINNRIAAIYYQQDMFEEAFFYYLDTLEQDETNPEALMRLGFMAIGVKEFEIAEKFMKQINESIMKNPSYFIGKGVIAAMLNRGNDRSYFEMAWQLKNSSIAGFLLAVSLMRDKKFKDALEICQKLQAENEYVQFTLNQLIMLQYCGMSDYAIAQSYAKQCIELAQKNEWKNEQAEASMHYALFCIALNNPEAASEYLIEAEFLRTHDIDIIDLANYKMDLEEGSAIPGKTSPRGYNLKNAIKDLPEKLFPRERYYEIAGLKLNANINIRGMLNQDGRKIISKLNQLKPDNLSRFINTKGNSFRNICIKIIQECGYKSKREIPCLESEGANFLAVLKDNEESLAVFRLRKWRNVNMSDVFIMELLNSMTENGAQKGYIIGSADLTIGAKKLMKVNEGKIIFVSGKELDSLLDKVIPD